MGECVCVCAGGCVYGGGGGGLASCKGKDIFTPCVFCRKRGGGVGVRGWGWVTEGGGGGGGGKLPRLGYLILPPTLSLSKE